eukprot:TRINITY_DN35163_c0_g1_i1.p2 TRINITY_DN35163_c0_g1~~TRINITY_DN35163_c0_g1_i1.p2  ORF type:complete len:234 (-),score=65.91 TRINITY_DN35163_c0_g1_i1:143-844(-)
MALFGLTLPKVEKTEADVPVAKRPRDQEGKPGKGAKAKAMDADGNAALLANLAKLSLKNSQQVRVLHSISIDTLQLPSDLPLIASIKESMQSFNDAAKDIKNKPNQEIAREQLGQPHIFAWQALCEHVNKLMKEAKEDNKGILAHTKEIEGLAHHMDKLVVMQSQVKVCKVCKCWNSSIVRLEISCTPNTTAMMAWADICKFLVSKHKGKLKQGVAPRANLEREIQDALDRMQ